MVKERGPSYGPAAAAEASGGPAAAAEASGGPAAAAEASGGPAAAAEASGGPVAAAEASGGPAAAAEASGGPAGGGPPGPAGGGPPGPAGGRPPVSEPPVTRSHVDRPWCMTKNEQRLIVGTLERISKALLDLPGGALHDSLTLAVDAAIYSCDRSLRTLRLDLLHFASAVQYLPISRTNVVLGSASRALASRIRRVPKHGDVKPVISCLNKILRCIVDHHTRNPIK